MNSDLYERLSARHAQQLVTVTFRDEDDPGSDFTGRREARMVGRTLDRAELDWSGVSWRPRISDIVSIEAATP